MSKVDGHVFNDDLLANPGDARKARELFPKVMHALEHEELIKFFRKADSEANDAKKWWRLGGLAVVIMGAISLIGAALLTSHIIQDERAARIVTRLSAVCGLISVAVGGIGLISGHFKKRWLLGRFETERLRQFHFQALVCHFADVIGTAGRQDEFDRRRHKWFEHFKLTIVNGRHAAFEDMLGDVGEAEIWLHSRARPPTEEHGLVVEQLFSAYRTLRIDHQLRYAAYKVSQNERMSARTLLSILGNASLIALCALVVVHLIIVALPGVQLGSYSPPEWLHLIVVLIAIAALIISAMNEGLKPSQDVERYQSYRARVKSIRERYEQANTIEGKLTVMEDMERISFHEMRDFLKTHHDAKFVL